MFVLLVGKRVVSFIVIFILESFTKLTPCVELWVIYEGIYTYFAETFVQILAKQYYLTEFCYELV